ncbi:MAG: endolytic transglycosylase MltG, partial [Acidimicrobiia bacterium]
KVQGRVVVPEGSRLAEVVGIIARSSDIPRKEVVAALGDDAAIGLPPYAEGHPEGYLFPATYVVDPGTTASSLVRQMVGRFHQAAEGVGLESRGKALGVTPAEAVVVASLVEGEARHAEDFGKVARVVYNRLDEGMRLQFDSTINYALDADKTTVSLQDLEANSPYNTYRHTGLPPGPISSPGEAALEAALDPPKGDWLYFVTVDDAGTTKFTSDYQEFLRFKEELNRNRG